VINHSYKLIKNINTNSINIIQTGGLYMEYAKRIPLVSSDIADLWSSYM
jgi:hypothetical protein